MDKQTILGIIPARLGSTRFHEKLLVEIKGKSMIQRVYEQTKKARGLDQVIVATDHEKIRLHVHSFGGEVIMTSTNHPSGTDRCAEAASKLAKRYNYIVNIQGDEPFIDPRQIEELIALLDGKTAIATLVKSIDHVGDLSNTGEVKVVFNDRFEALYFSRFPIPFIRDIEDQAAWLSVANFYKHVGLYAYKHEILNEITKLPPSLLEKSEGLEQLRWLEHGFPIKLGITSYDSKSIETPEDLHNLLKISNL